MLRTCWYLQGKQNTLLNYQVRSASLRATKGGPLAGARRSFLSKRLFLCAKKEKKSPLEFSSPEEMKEQMEAAQTEFDSLFSKLGEELLRESPRVSNTKPFTEKGFGPDPNKEIQEQLVDLSKKMDEHFKKSQADNAFFADAIRKVIETGSLPNKVEEDLAQNKEAAERFNKQKEMMTDGKLHERRQLENHLALDRTDLERARTPGQDLDALAKERRERIQAVLASDPEIVNAELQKEVAFETAAQVPGSSLPDTLPLRIQKLEAELAQLSAEAPIQEEISDAETKEQLRSILPDLEQALGATPPATTSVSAAADQMPPEQQLPHEMIEDRSASGILEQLAPLIRELTSMKLDSEEDHTENTAKLEKLALKLKGVDPAFARLHEELNELEAKQDARVDAALDEALGEDDLEDEEEDEEDLDLDENVEGDGSSGPQTPSNASAASAQQTRTKPVTAGDLMNATTTAPKSSAQTAVSSAAAVPPDQLRGSAAAHAYRFDQALIQQEEANELEEQIRFMDTHKGEEFLREEARRLDAKLSQHEGLRTLLAGVPEPDESDQSGLSTYFLYSRLVDSLDEIEAQKEFVLTSTQQDEKETEDEELDLDDEDEEEDEEDDEEAADERDLAHDRELEAWQAKEQAYPLATAGSRLTDFEADEELSAESARSDAAANLIDDDGIPAAGADSDSTLSLSRQQTDNSLQRVMPWHLDADEFVHKFVIDVRSHQTITRGGRKQSFSAFVLMGNGNGSAGLGYGRGLEANIATEEAWRDAYKNIITIDRWEGRTILGEILATHCKTKVIMRGLPAEGGLRMHDHFRNLCDAFGITDMFCKVIGRRHLPHAYKAMFEALQEQRAPYSLAKAMGKVYFNPNKVVTPMSPYGR